MSRIRMATPEGGEVSLEATGVRGTEPLGGDTRLLLDPTAALAPLSGRITVEVGMDLVPLSVAVAGRPERVAAAVARGCRG